jgi:Na+/H+ antiporter NhaD/arsenite permease-like protein
VSGAFSNPTVVAALIFVLTYIGVVGFIRRKTEVICAGIALGVILGHIELPHIVHDISWNVMGIFTGTLLLSEFFVLSRAPDAIAAYLVRHTRTAGGAFLAVCAFASALSIVIENVAVVLVVAPIMFGLAKKIGVSPVPGMIAIAVCSNLQGAATLIGDPPSMILANYMQMNFNDFFWYQGRPGMFFAVQLGAVGSMLFLYAHFRRYRSPVDFAERVEVRSHIPTVLTTVMVGALTLSSFVDPGFKWFGGSVCMALGLLGFLFSTRFTTVAERKQVVLQYDWASTIFLAGVFVMVGMLERTGVIEAFAGFLARNLGGNPVVVFSLVVWASVAFSAFIDNVPYLTMMIPVVQLVSETVGIPMELLVFGLLIGASLGGNITPVGASANIVGVGLLRKRGHHVSSWDFVKVGLPFTVTATVLGSLFIYFAWR